MKTVCEVNKCNGCMACSSICPKQCITIKDSIESMNAEVDESLCIDCKLCEEICPNVTMAEQKKPIEWKQGWADEEIRSNSTSGGAAFAIIKSFIQSGGYVASCLFKEGDFSFDITNNEKVAKKFVGSKYVKSNPNNIYKKVQEKLKTDKVLFVGLPCQVAAMKNYIKNHDYLYTIDLICHGTPSMKLLKKYFSECDYEIDKLNDVTFRTKMDYGLCIDGKKISPPRVIDEYLCAFLTAIDYTENCYSCQFASTERVSDITLGDSWGTEYKEQEKNGVSLILIQSHKGQEMLSGSGIVLKAVELDRAISCNQQLSYPPVMTATRKRFFGLINKGKQFKKAAFICLPRLVIKQKIKLILLKLDIIPKRVN